MMELNKIFNLSNAFDENDKPNLLKYIGLIVTNPAYISNITYIILIISILFDIKMLIHSFIPLCITNGIIISIAVLKMESLKIKKKDTNFKTNKHIDIINSYYKKYKIQYKLLVIIIHFLIPFYIYYTNKYLDRKNHSNFILSFMLSIFIISVYTFCCDRDIYKDFIMNGSNTYYVLPLYLLCNMVVSYLYFY